MSQQNNGLKEVVCINLSGVENSWKKNNKFETHKAVQKCFEHKDK